MRILLLLLCSAAWPSEQGGTERGLVFGGNQEKVVEGSFMVVGVFQTDKCGESIPEFLFPEFQREQLQQWHHEANRLQEVWIAGG